MRTLLTISAISLAIAACGGGGGEGSSGNGDGSTSGAGLITSKFLAQKCPLSQQTSDPTWWRCLEGGYFSGYEDSEKKIPCTVSIFNGRFLYTSASRSMATDSFNDVINQDDIRYSEYFHGYSPQQGAHRFVGQIAQGKDGNGWSVRIETTHDRIPNFYDPGDNNIQFGYNGGGIGSGGFCYIPSLVIGK